MKKKLFLFIILVSYHLISIAEDCGDLSNHYGPFDFRTDKIRLPVVEENHFTNVTFSMAVFGGSNDDYSRKFKFTGQNSNKTKRTSIAGDLDYTLRAIPNYPRALYAMSEYQRIKQKKYKHPELWRPKNLTADCYFKRAIKFVNDDPAIYMVYGLYFHKRYEYKKALEQYRKSEKLDYNNIDLLYYLGLVNVELGDFKEANKYADLVYKEKYPLKGLMNKLKKHKKN